MATLRLNNVGFQRHSLEGDSQTFFDMFPQLTNQKRDIACPFILYLGTVNNTEYGETPGQVKIGDFTSFKRIFTGKDSQLAVWENSTFVKKIPNTNTMTKSFKTGKFEFLYRNSKGISNSLTPTNETIDAIQQQSETSISFILEGKTLTKDDVFKLWVIPTQSTNEFFIINSITEYVDSNDLDKIIYSEIIFTSLNDKLSSVGQQIEQYVSLAAPGEGFAFPKLKKTATTNFVELDFERLKNNGITELQLEVMGPAVLISLFAMGRRIKKNSLLVTSPKHLISYKINTPLASDLNQKTSGESAYYVIAAGEVDFVSFFNDWEENVKDKYDLNSRRNYEGYLATNKDLTLASNNPPTGDADFNIWDFQWLTDISTLTAEEKTFDGKAINYTEDAVILKDILTAPYLNFINSFIYLDTEKLPMSIEESVLWTTKSIPIVGGFLNVLTLGYPFGWKNTQSKIQAKLVNGFIPKSLYNYISTGTGASGEGNIPIDVFRSDTEDAVGALVGTNSIGSIFNMTLTDKLTKDNILKDTVDIGQEGGYLINGTETPLDPQLTEEEGFAIDFINIKMIGKADIKLTAYRYGTSLWTAYFQNRAKFTGSVREWSNSFKLSAWNEINSEVIDYPADIPDKPPISEIFEDISIVPPPGETEILYDGNIFNDQLQYLLSFTKTIKLIDFTRYGFIWEDFKQIYPSFTYKINEVTYFFDGFVDTQLNGVYEIKSIDVFETNNQKITLLDRGETATGTLYIQHVNVPESTTETIENANYSYTSKIEVYRKDNEIFVDITGTHNFNGITELDDIDASNYAYIINRFEESVDIGEITFNSAGRIKKKEKK